MQATRAIVAGASGYTGRELVRELRARGIPTVAHVRPDSPSLERRRIEFEALGATLDTTPWDARLLGDRFVALRPTLVFSALGTTLSRARRETRGGTGVAVTYESVDLALTTMWIEASVACGSVERFAFVSAAGARPGTRNPYLRVRVEMEDRVRTSGLSFTCARPAFVSGPDREESRPLERAGAIVGDLFLATCAALGARGFRERYRSLRGGELARGLVAAALDPLCKDRALDAGELRALARRS